ncbi:MAG: hypothetical protein JWM95_99 [Gemmatimonadetes bacterium]|nr:hypothetical protein [Gemmatimonadota bacterium]
MKLAPLWIALAVIGTALSARVEPGNAKRPVVLLVHGRGYLTRDSAAFRREALTSLREGAFRATGDSLLTDGDLRIVWYADLMDTRRRVVQGAAACASAEKKQPDGAPAPVIQILAMVASALLDATAQDSDTTDARDLAGDLRFFGDPATRCATETRIRDALVRAKDDGRPVILAAHSLGALVTWGHLMHRDTSKAPDVRRLVTMGSPIGNDQLRELFFGRSGILAMPRGVRSWVNALHTDDPFAARLVTPDSTGKRAVDIPGISDLNVGRVDGDPHDLRGYLRDTVTSKSILGAWCEAMPDTKSRPAGCAVLLK